MDDPPTEIAPLADKHKAGLGGGFRSIKGEDTMRKTMRWIVGETAAVGILLAATVWAGGAGPHAQQGVNHVKEGIGHVKEAIAHLEESFKAGGDPHAKESLAHAKEALKHAEEAIGHAEQAAEQTPAKKPPR